MKSFLDGKGMQVEVKTMNILQVLKQFFLMI